jgi:hypothetical protein
MNKYKQEVYSPPQPDRHYLHTTQAAAVTPLLQSLITGIVVFVLVIVLALHWRWRDPWTWATISGVTAWAGMWMQLTRHWFSLTRLEEWTQTEINQDGMIGAQPAPEILVRISENNGQHETRGTLPMSLDQAQTLARGLLDGQPITERRWAGPEKPFSSAGWRTLRDELVRRGMLIAISDRDPRTGFRLTRAGKAAMEALVRDDPPAPLR